MLTAAARVPGTVVLTGDIHVNYANDLVARPELPAVGVEVVTTSVSSGGDGSESTVRVKAGAGWETAAEVRGNVRTTVDSRFAARSTTEMRIVTYAANGTNDWSRIVEISVHPEVPDELPATDLPR